MIRQTHFQLFTASLLCLLLLPKLVQHGMFMDGTQYACVARNLAHHQGSFWFPYLSATWYKMGHAAFMEHLPLTYYLQSRFFLLMGDSVFTEKIYCLVAAMLCSGLLVALWKIALAQHRQLQPYGWLAVLLWCIVPSVFWSFQNNMLENTVSVMVLAAVYFGLRGTGGARWIFHCVVCGTFVCLAVWCKGVPGLFPVAVFLCYAASGQMRWKAAIGRTAVAVAVPVVVFTLLFLLHAAARESLSFYVEKRLLYRVQEDPTVDNRFKLLFWLLSDLLVPLGLGLLLLAVFRWRGLTLGPQRIPWRLLYFFVLLGCCGVFPLCLTRVQRAAYFVPALPFFGLAAAAGLAPFFHQLLGLTGATARRVIKTVAWASCGFTLLICVCLMGKVSRDQDVLSDVHRIGQAIGRDQVVLTHPALYERWDFQFYLLRYYNISLGTGDKPWADYLLLPEATTPPDVAMYRPLPTVLPGYRMYKKESSQ